LWQVFSQLHTSDPRLLKRIHAPIRANTGNVKLSLAKVSIKSAFQSLKVSLV
jgi:hypothetical protein